MSRIDKARGHFFGTRTRNLESNPKNLKYCGKSKNIDWINTVVNKTNDRHKIKYLCR